MSAAIASAITPYGGVHTYLSCKQSYFLNPLVSSSVPCRNSIRHKTAQTCRQSCFGREDYTSCGACRPTPGHGTGTRLKASAVPLYPAVYTPNLLPTIHIAVYTYRCIYSYTDIRLHTLHLRCFFTFTFIYPSISVSGFDLTFHPFVVIFDFYFAKVSQAGNTANTGTSPIDGKLFMTLRNHRLRFPENFYRPIVCLRSP